MTKTTISDRLKFSAEKTARYVGSSFSRQMLRTFFSLLTLFWPSLSFAGSVNESLEDKVSYCIFNMADVSIYTCLHNVKSDCTEIRSEVQCYYTVGLAATEQYTRITEGNKRSSIFLESMNELILSNCRAIADSETDRAARDWAHSYCTFEGRILAILADNPYAERD